ncbi:hypothetical protein ABZX66_03605 [Micromonospora aurantiaca]|uniref:hypothetical protein n=1 Tax=Micromonospora aurantiaca (nom. illeg.) TaxID=47850 RepID=UPI0033BD71E3
MNRYVERLARMMPPPPRSSAPPNWPAVERSLGFALPGDYKDLVDRYGPGRFDDFLAVLVPGHPVPRLDLVHGVAEATETLRAYASSGEALPAPVDGLTAVALTDNGDTVYWLRDPGSPPDRWRIAVNGARDFGEWHLFDGCLAHFLVAVLNRESVVPGFPGDFPYPDVAPIFTPYGY